MNEIINLRLSAKDTANAAENKVPDAETNYFRVYFRIKTIGYSSSDGWISEENRRIFTDEAAAIFLDQGWSPKEKRGDHAAGDIFKGKERLYLHPMFFSGEILEESISQIDSLLMSAQSFSHYSTDIYERYFDMDETQYRAYLASRKESIVSDLLEGYRTKRRNLFIPDDHKTVIAKRHGLKRLGYYNDYDKIMEQFLSSVIEEMTAEGRLIKSRIKSGYGYRTATDKDVIMKKGA